MATLVTFDNSEIILGTYDCHNCVEIFGQTDVGLVRKNNEDSIGCFADLGLAVVADGVGGYLSGQIASQIAVDELYRQMSQKLTHINSGQVNKKLNVRHSGMVLKETVENINSVIYRTALDEARYRGMSTTVVIFMLFNNIISIAHVGDSRAYLLRKQKMTQLTRDHSVLQSMIDRGIDVEKQKRLNKHKNLLLKALGAVENVECGIWETPGRIGDILMLCSDGIHGVLKNQEIERILYGYNGDLQEITEKLIAEAKEAGSRDNMSVITARITQEHSIRPDLFRRIFGFFH